MRRHTIRLLLTGLLIGGTAVQAPTAAAAPPDAGGEVVRAWNDLSFRTTRLKSASDAVAARVYAMVNVAIYDAVNGLAQSSSQRRAPAVVAPVPGAHGDARAAAAGAAHDVLVALYPDQAAQYDARLATDLAAASPAAQARAGREWGAEVAQGVLAARSNDGSSPSQTQFPPPGQPIGAFHTSWGGVQFRDFKPFVIADPDSYTGEGPPALSSEAYATAFNEVKVLGNAALPDAEKSATFSFWHLAGGTNQPPGAWLQVAQDVSESQRLSLSDTARLFALQSMAMADSVAPTYQTKYDHFFWRPQTAIRAALDDGNPATAPDTQWAARAGSIGSSPENWSGHSSFSAAAATVLAGFFCQDDLGFTLTSDTSGATRSYPSFSAAALEAGRSRVLGGFHFQFSNQAGLDAGRAIADEVLAKALLPVRGSARRDTCAG